MRKSRKVKRRSCKLCKPNKMSGWPTHALGHTGFGKLKREIIAAIELRHQK